MAKLKSAKPRNPGLNLSQVGNNFASSTENFRNNSQSFIKGADNVGGFLTDTAQALAPILSLIPGINKSPALNSLLVRAEGANLTKQLTKVEPKLQDINLDKGAFNVDVGGNKIGTGAQSIAQQAVKEREQLFNELTSLRGEQEATTAEFASNLRGLLARGGELDRHLAGLSNESRQRFNRAVGDIANISRNINETFAAGLKISADIFKGVLDRTQKIREDFTNEVVGRMSQQNSTIAAQNVAAANEHLRAIQPPPTPEERASIREFYRRNANTQMAQSSLAFQEKAVELKATLDSQLESSTVQAGNQFTSATTGLVQNQQAQQAAVGRLLADIEDSRAARLTQIATARNSLFQVANSLAVDGFNTLFSMVTNTVRPVFVVSDVLQGALSNTFDAIAFNNTNQQQRLANRMAVLNPMHAGAFAALGILNQAGIIDKQADAQKSASDKQFTGDVIGAGASFAAPFFNRKKDNQDQQQKT